ncbi:MAG: HAD family hydrolase [Deltaproteobacteria bacterium]|nr:HAD family hydrolase [Deltaproteobacteria bacterium]
MFRSIRHGVPLCATVLTLCVATTGWGKWQETTTSPQQTALLTTVAQLVQETPHPVAVFDLDSTLYKNYGRWVVILHEFGAMKNIPALRRITATQISDSFDHLGVLHHDAGLDRALAERLLPEFKTFWTTRFFSNPYLRYDEALPGAVAFVKVLYKAGAHIVYITGRDEKNMRAGTVAKLKKDGFPINGSRTLLLMKPTVNATIGEKSAALRQTDLDWKQKAIAHVKSLGTVVASFENEPDYINLYHDAFHKEGTGTAVFLDTDMYPRETPVPLRHGVVTISGFLQ